MNAFWRCLVFSVLSGVSFAWPARAADFPDFGYTPPTDWTGRRFELSQDYPTTLPSAEAVPWKTIDFKTQPEQYMQAVIDYCYEGNVDQEFEGANNPVRKWYHAPWLHVGNNAREFVRGLTRERTSPRRVLAGTQTDPARNYAVGFYNPRGGFLIGQVWADANDPDTSSVAYAEDAVAFNLLFTTATDAQVPFMVGSPEWVADLDRSSTAAEVNQRKVRLLQIDIAVRDSRSLCAGWVFGTFQYDSTVSESNPWRKLRATSLQWGNNPELKPSHNMPATESWINPASPVVAYRKSLPVSSTLPRTLGWADRANGPVDNPLSSCLSCHATAQIPARSGMIPRNDADEEERLRWFRNFAAGESFDDGTDTLDFSLQLGVGIQNHRSFLEFVDNQGGVAAAESAGPRRLLSANESPVEGWQGKYEQEYEFTRDPDHEDEAEEGVAPLQFR